MNHGHGGYTNHGCRCDVCRKAARDYQRAYQPKYRQANKDTKLAYFREYYTANKDVLRAKDKTDHGRALRRKRNGTRRARQLGQFIEDVDPRIVYQTHGGRCGICGEHVAEDEFQVDHVIPISRGGMHGYVNVQPSHAKCNRSKGAKLQHQP